MNDSDGRFAPARWRPWLRHGAPRISWHRILGAQFNHQKSERSGTGTALSFVRRQRAQVRTWFHGWSWPPMSSRNGGVDDGAELADRVHPHRVRLRNSHRDHPPTPRRCLHHDPAQGPIGRRRAICSVGSDKGPGYPTRSRRASPQIDGSREADEIGSVQAVSSSRRSPPSAECAATADRPVIEAALCIRVVRRPSHERGRACRAAPPRLPGTATRSPCGGASTEPASRGSRGRG